MLCDITAAEGQSMTLVITDVEGSTELWEWDHETMMQVVAQALQLPMQMKAGLLLLRVVHG